MTAEVGIFATAAVGGDSGASVGTPAEETKALELVYGSAKEFLHEQLLPTDVRDVDGRAAKWCIEWYFHPEARIEALWRAWEHVRLDGPPV